MFDYRLLKTLSCVTELGGFESAARSLHVTQSAVSQRIKQLEDQVGQLLIVRSNPVRPTRYGQKLIEHYLRVNLLESNILNETEIGRMRVPIAVNADSLATWFIPAIKELVASYDIYFDMQVGDQDITHRAFQQGEVIGCVTSRAKPFQGCKAVKLGEMRCVAVASKSFIAQYLPEPITPNKVKQAPVLVFDSDDQLIAVYLDKFYGLKMADVRYHSIPSTEAFILAAKNGMALSVLPEAQVINELNSGAVININQKQFLTIPLYWHCWAMDTTMGKTINNAIVSGAKKYLR